MSARGLSIKYVVFPHQRAWCVVWNALLALFWLMTILPIGGTASESSGADQSTFLYAAYTLPVMIFSVATTLVCLGRLQYGTAPSVLLGLFFIISVAVSLARMDTSTLKFLVGFCIPLYILMEWRPTISLTLLNTLALISIPIMALLNIVHLSDYGVWPGASLDEELPWRIAMFQFVPSSAFFAGVLLLANVNDQTAFLRKTTILVAAYFLVLSGTRSAIIATALGFSYIWLADRRMFRGSVMRWGLFMSLLTAFFCAVVFSSVLVVLSGSSSFANELLTHSTNGAQSETDAAKSVGRLWIWAQHWTAFSSSPLFGIGTFDFDKISDGGLAIATSGSEAFLTGMLARLGLVTLLCFAAFIAAAARAMRENNHLAVAMVLMILCAMFGYGSIVTTHDFAFMAMVGFVVMERRVITPPYLRLTNNSQGGSSYRCPPDTCL
ncbi:MAG TPA: O-antigen ligase family protein [Acidobacteriaceae bacterium]